MKLVVLGLSITSSWGNGHATTYRGLLREMRRRGHEIVFLERDVPWYAQHRDLPNPVFCTTRLYRDLDELRRSHTDAVATHFSPHYEKDRPGSRSQTVRRKRRRQSMTALPRRIPCQPRSTAPAEFIDPHFSVLRFQHQTALFGVPICTRLHGCCSLCPSAQR